MNQTESTRKDQFRAIASKHPLPAHAVNTDRLEIRRLLALLWLTIAWVAGTLVFEVAAIGAESKQPVGSQELSSEVELRIDFGEALDKDETDVCLAITPLDGLFRVENNERLKPTIDSIIETETHWLAQRELMKSNELLPDDPDNDPEFSLDSIESPLGITKARFDFSGPLPPDEFPGIQQVNHASSVFAPIFVGSPAASNSLEEDITQREIVGPAETFLLGQLDKEKIESSLPPAPEQVQDSPRTAAVESSNTTDSGESAKTDNKPTPTPVATKTASEKTRPVVRQMATAKIVRARPISLIQSSVELPTSVSPQTASPTAKAETDRVRKDDSPAGFFPKLYVAKQPARPRQPRLVIGPAAKPNGAPAVDVLPKAPVKPKPLRSDRTVEKVTVESVPKVATRAVDNIKPVVEAVPLADAQPAAAKADATAKPGAEGPSAAAQAVADNKPVAKPLSGAMPEPVKPVPIVEQTPEPAVKAAIAADRPDQQPSDIELPLAEPKLQPSNPPQPIRQPDEHIAAGWPFAVPVVAKRNQPSVALNVDNADVRTVFEMLARGYGMNILVSPDVAGVVTANVEGLTPEQTLKGVLKMCSLRAQVEDDVILVYPADKLPADARQLRLFPLDFARSEVLEPTVQGLLSPIGNAYTSILDDKDNLKTREAIVVVDTPESIRQIESFIYQIDQAPRQVMIEARVLEVELSDAISHGVDFGSILKRDVQFGTNGLAAAAAGDAVFFARIDGSEVNALIELLETTTDAKTLANPKIMVVNGQQAKIQVGQQLGFTVATVTQTSTIQDVQFLDTGVVLSVKPTISRDNKVMMEVKPEVSNGQINPDTLLPEEETRELETSVLLNDHQGMVIGGLIQENDRTVIKKLPWLGDVRHVGKFFQRREAVRSRTEIIVALVPHIVDIDQCMNCDQCDQERQAIEYERAGTPILQGPLQRACRPWEPRLPDTVGAERHYDVNKINRMIP